MISGDTVPISDPRLLARLLVVALFSSVLPYGVDQIVLLSVFPATALLVGAVMLPEVPTLIEGIGLVAVSAAIALTSQRVASAVETVVPPE